LPSDYYETYLEKVRAVQSLETTMGMDMMGRSVEINIKQKLPHSFYMKVGNEHMVFTEQKTDGVKASIGGMGQSQVLTEGKEFEDIKSQAVIFSQLNYMTDEYVLELKGIEDLEGDNCYKIEIKDPKGKTTYEYYSMESSLLVRQVSNQEGQGGQMISMINDFMDYEETDGVKFPTILRVTGMMPTPVEMKLKSLTVNPELSDDIFKVE